MFLVVLHRLAVMFRGFSCRFPWALVLNDDRRRGMSASATAQIRAMLGAMNAKAAELNDLDHSINEAAVAPSFVHLGRHVVESTREIVARIPQFAGFVTSKNLTLLK